MDSEPVQVFLTPTRLPSQARLLGSLRVRATCALEGVPIAWMNYY